MQTSANFCNFLLVIKSKFHNSPHLQKILKRVWPCDLQPVLQVVGTKKIPGRLRFLLSDTQFTYGMCVYGDDYSKIEDFTIVRLKSFVIQDVHGSQQM